MWGYQNRIENILSKKHSKKLIKEARGIYRYWLYKEGEYQDYVEIIYKQQEDIRFRIMIYVDISLNKTKMLTFGCYGTQRDYISSIVDAFIDEAIRENKIINKTRKYLKNWNGKM